VFTPAGELVEAPAGSRARDRREALRALVLASERARLRRTDPDEALELWRGLCDGTWSVVETFDTDGRRYLVLHENEPDVRGLRALSRREEQVVGFAALGHAENLVGYELGLSDSTVRSHLASAMRKLGVRTRYDLILLVSSLRHERGLAPEVAGATAPEEAPE
jgi:DNA-binding NarL/FixJ family response regulator